MNDQAESIFLFSLFKGTEYIENRFLMSTESFFKTIYSLKFNHLRFVQRIRQMMILDSTKLSLNELSEKYGIPLRIVSDIIKDQEIFTSQIENSDKKPESQLVFPKHEGESSKNQNLSLQKDYLVNQSQDAKFQVQYDNQSTKDLSHYQLKAEPEEINQRNKKKLNELVRNILTISKNPEIPKNEHQEQCKLLPFTCSTLNDQEVTSDKKQNSQKKQQIKVQNHNKLNRIQQSFDINQNGDYICKQCQKIYTQQRLSTLKNKQVMYNHIYKKHTKKFKCVQCNLTFKKLKILDKHYRNAHPQE